MTEPQSTTPSGIRRIGTIQAAVSEQPALNILAIEPIEGGLRIVGQVDLSNVDQFREALAQAGTGAWELVLDLADCTYMGSEAISALIETSKDLGEGDLILRSPTEFLQKVFDLTGIGRLRNVRVETAGTA
jgi:anti-anti-sigma factor